MKGLLTDQGTASYVRQSGVSARFAFAKRPCSRCTLLPKIVCIGSCLLPPRPCRSVTQPCKQRCLLSRHRQLRVRSAAVGALVQEGWPLWAALSACAAGGQVCINSLTHIPWLQSLLILTRCTATQCVFDVLDHRYWSKEPLLALPYLHLYSPCSWHLHCQLVASCQSPLQHTILSGHTSCLWVRPSTSLSLTCGSKSSRLHLSPLRTSRHLVLLPTDVVACTYLVSVSVDLHARRSRQCPLRCCWSIRTSCSS